MDNALKLDDTGQEEQTDSLQSSLKAEAGRRTSIGSWRLPVPPTVEVNKAKGAIKNKQKKALLAKVEGILLKQQLSRTSTELAEATAALTHLVPFLESQGSDVPRMVASCAWTVRKSEGEIVCKQGEEGTQYFMLLAGGLSVHVKGADGVEKRVGSIHKGKAFGEMSLLSDQPRSTTLVSTRNSLIAVISKQDFLDIFRGQYAILGAEVSEFLRSRAPAFANVDPKWFRQMLSSVNTETLPAQQSINPPSLQRVYIIRDGQASLLTRTSEGKNVPLATLGPGDILGAASAFPELARGHVVKPITDVFAYGIPADIFANSMDPRTAERVRSELAFRTDYVEGRKLMPKVEELVSATSSQQPSSDVDGEVSWDMAPLPVQGVEEAQKSLDPFKHHLLRQPHRPPSKLLTRLRQGQNNPVFGDESGNEEDEIRDLPAFSLHSGSATIVDNV